MKVRIVTLGCKLNFAESSALMNELIRRGYERAKQGEQADIVIVNTCTVTDTADQKDRQAIHRVRRENPNAKIVVTGCYARLHPREIADMVEVDRVVKKRDDVFQPAYSKDDRTRCFLKVQDGCNYFCTYCAIPYARGRSRNPSIRSVCEQAMTALNEGAKEIVLTGVNIGDFGRTTGERFIDLLQALDTLPYDDTYRLRIGSVEPNLLSYEIIDLVAQSKHIAPHFHIPLQSGSDEVLRIMNRHYDTALFRERVAYIRKVLPYAFIGVDCMVGVRGETTERWEQYVEFIQSLQVSQLHVFTYSERAGTRMLTMDLPVIPMTERHRRSQVLHGISEDKLQAFYALCSDMPQTVLWEGKNDHGVMYGFSENYIRHSRTFDKNRINTFEQISAQYK